MKYVRLLPGVVLLFVVYGLIPAAANGQTAPRLQYVTTARQDGPVGYRDPLGVMSPDGVWLAYAAGTGLYLQRTVGGPVTALGPGVNRIIDLAWTPDSKRLAARERVLDRSAAYWFVYDVATGERAPLWANKTRLHATLNAAQIDIDTGDLQHLAWSPEGDSVAGVVHTATGSQLWILGAASGNGRVRGSNKRLTYPAWRPDGQGVACLVMADGRQGVDLSCTGRAAQADDQEAYGPFAFSPDGQHLYFAAPNDQGALDLWRRAVDGSRAERLTAFSRDTYAPTVGRDGRVLFKIQDYRVFIAVAPANGGPTRAVTTFQSETPSWDWTSEHIAFTYGSWRRVTDDLHYPDIAQDIGIVRVDAAAPASAPETIVRASYSEDQGMHWSPNGRWIAFHTHADGTDDVWLQPSDGSTPARPISEGGVETGWPRWSPDGRWIAYMSERQRGPGQHGVLYLVGVDQETGEITTPQREVPLDIVVGGAALAEWSPDSEHLAFESVTEPGRKAIYLVGRDGGTPEQIHEFACDQLYSGLSVSPDFQWIAFIAPAADGYYQVFRVPVAGGEAEQVTFDPSDKTHPAYAPDGARIAFTVFSYQAHFWVLSP